MMNKPIVKLVMVFIVLISLSGLVSALGIGPTKKMINFEPNMEKEVTLRIINNEHKDFKVVVYARGELSKYLSIKDSLINVDSEHEFIEFRYDVKLPDKFEKARVHEAEIVIMEFEDEFGIEIPDEDAEKILSVREAVEYIDNNKEINMINSHLLKHNTVHSSI